MKSLLNSLHCILKFRLIEPLGYILDPLGRKVTNLEFTKSKQNYEITNFSSGVYTLVINYADGHSENKRIVIK